MVNNRKRKDGLPPLILEFDSISHITLYDFRFIYYSYDCVHFQYKLKGGIPSKGELLKHLRTSFMRYGISFGNIIDEETLEGVNILGKVTLEKLQTLDYPIVDRSVNKVILKSPCLTCKGKNESKIDCIDSCVSLKEYQNVIGFSNTFSDSSLAFSDGGDTGIHINGRSGKA